MSKQTKHPKKQPRPATNALTARIDERAALLAASEDGAALVPRMAPEELLFTLRAATRDDALAVLEHARPSQVRFLLDMELWKGEEVDADKAAEWLALLDDCGQKPLGRWLSALEVADIAALAGRLARASLSNEAGMVAKEDGEGDSSFTLDGVHYLTARADSAQRLQRLLTLLRLSDRKKHDRVLDILFTGFDSEDEEEAARFRRARLAEHGFPDFTEARRIYASLDVTGLLHQPPRVEAEDAPASGVIPPAYPLALTGGPASEALRASLDRLAHTEHGPALLAQLAKLTNMVVAADALDTGDIDSFARAARKVAGRLTIALELLHPNAPEEWDRTLSVRWLEHLFRVGQTRTRKGQEAAKRFLREGWPKGDKAALALLGEPLAEAVRALAHPLPMLAVPTPEGFARRDFANLAELLGAERALAKGTAAGRFAVEALGADPKDAGMRERDADFAEVFLTSLANGALGRGLSYAPLTPGDAAKALSALLSTENGGRKVVAKAVKAALSKSKAKTAFDPAETALLTEFLAEALGALEEEFGNLEEGEAPDPRFFKGLWLAG